MSLRSLPMTAFSAAIANLIAAASASSVGIKNTPNRQGTIDIMSKLIERNLPFSDTYTLESIRRQSIETCDIALPCANCNADIINIAKIHNQDGKSFYVGLDCVKTLIKATTVENSFEPVYDFTTTLRELAAVQKHVASGCDLESDEMYYRVKFRKPNGGTSFASVSKHYMQKFNLSI